MDTRSSITSPAWHIPRPSLTGSSASSAGDSRSRGGSASSQGSSSNHSTHSVSSGSLLLSAAHLARMQTPDSNLGKPRHTVLSIPEVHEPADVWRGVKRSAGHTASLASSTHFTVVNGYTKQKPHEPCCCAHSHQITVLVVSMTILFSACILAAICFVEMRMRKETGMYKYS